MKGTIQLNIGMTEIVLVIIIAICLIKPENSGKALKAVGSALRSFKEAYSGFEAEAADIVSELGITPNIENEENQKSCPEHMGET